MVRQEINFLDKLNKKQKGEESSCSQNSLEIEDDQKKEKEVIQPNLVSF